MLKRLGTDNILQTNLPSEKIWIALYYNKVEP